MLLKPVATVSDFLTGPAQSAPEARLWILNGNAQLRFAPASEVRGKVKQGTMWPVSDDTAKKICAGITAWLGHTMAA